MVKEEERKKERKKKGKKEKQPFFFFFQGRELYKLTVCWGGWGISQSPGFN